MTGKTEVLGRNRGFPDRPVLQEPNKSVPFRTNLESRWQ